MKQFVKVDFDSFRHTRGEREGEESVDSGQRTGVIDANPAVKMQSASASPGIAIAPRAVVEVPMPESDDGSTGSGPAVHITDALMGSGDEEVNQVEENESWEDDDEEEVDEINHAKLPSVVIHVHSPGRRAHTSSSWTHLRRIHKYDVPGHEMNADCTHVCVCPLADGEEGPVTRDPSRTGSWW